MDIPLIVITPLTDTTAMCKQVEPHLRTLWVEPMRFATESVGVIENHLRICKSCGDAFLKICGEVQPPWQSKPVELTE